MRMKKSVVSILLCCFVTVMSSQEVLTEKFDLPKKVNETSGLIFYNNQIITHNDSGGKPKLYVLDTLNGRVVRTVTVLNAVNEDWEEIAQDNDDIYIGDFGNNRGSRRDLKIYKISKTDFLQNDTISAKTIDFSLSDQVNFDASKKNNFDIEAVVAVDDLSLIHI